MLERGDALARLRYLGTVKISNNDRSMNAAFRDNLAPGRNNKAMSVGLSPTFVLAGLGCSQDKAAIFDGSGADQHAPMRLAGGPGKGGWNGNKIGTCLSFA